MPLTHNLAASTTGLLSYLQSTRMILRTVEQVRRIFLIIAGFTLLLAGFVMLVTPGPGLVVIVFGLSLLAAEFVWARRLMNRLKREGERVRHAVWHPAKDESPKPSPEAKSS